VKPTKLADLTVTLRFRVAGLTFWDALKLRLAGPELRTQAAAIVTKMTEAIELTRPTPEDSPDER
jgi:hypothetical protein